MTATQSLHGPLYRGLSAPLPAQGLRSLIREDRKPRDTGNRVLFNIAFNLMIERHFGVPLVRRRSLFVCGDPRRALHYAAQRDRFYLGVVEPEPPFRYLWCPTVPDSAQLADDLTYRYDQCFYQWQKSRCSALRANLLLTLDGVDAFFDGNPDIDRGGFAWSGTGLRKRIYAMLDSCAVSSVQNTYPYIDKNLDEAVGRGVEIMLFDCPNGYMVRPVNGSLIDQIVAADTASGELPIAGDQVGGSSDVDEGAP